MIAGTNGKSTLLMPLRDNRAIVSNIAGTTRDTIEEVIQFEGFRLRLIDTAGLRKAMMLLSKLAWQKPRKIGQGTTYALCLDAGQESPHSVRKHVESLHHESAVILIEIKWMNAVTRRFGRMPSRDYARFYPKHRRGYLLDSG